MARRRQHWMDRIITSIKERSDAAVPHVATGIKGVVPFGYEPPNRTDEVKSFLNSTPEERMQHFVAMGPEAWQKWSSNMMNELTKRFGPAAQTMFPMIESTPIEATAAGMQWGEDDGSVGIPAAQMELTQILGFDPFNRQEEGNAEGI